MKARITREKYTGTTEKIEKYLTDRGRTDGRPPVCGNERHLSLATDQSAHHRLTPRERVYLFQLRQLPPYIYEALASRLGRGGSIYATAKFLCSVRPEISLGTASMVGCPCQANLPSKNDSVF